TKASGGEDKLIGHDDLVPAAFKAGEVENVLVELNRTLLAQIIAQHQAGLIVGKDGRPRPNLTKEGDRGNHILLALAIARDIRGSPRRDEIRDQSHSESD